MTLSEQRAPSTSMLSTSTAAAILSLAIVVTLIVAVLCGMGLLALSWLSSPAVQDYRVLHNYWAPEHGELTSLEVTPQHVLVGSTKTGILVFDRETRLWRELPRWRTDGALPTDTVLQVLLEPRGKRLYYRTSLGGLASSAANLKDWRTLYPASECPVNPDQFRVLSMLGEHWLALGTRSEGLILYNVRTRIWSHMKKAENAQGLSSNVVNDLLYLEESGGGLLLVATPMGVDVFRVDPAADGSPLRFAARELAGQGIETFDPTGRAHADHPVVARTSAGGIVWRQRDKQWQQLVGDRGFRSQRMPEVSIARLDERHHLLIVGTAGQGWDVYNTTARDWINPERQRGRKVNDIVAFNEQWWVATDEGVQIYDPLTNQVNDPPMAPQYLTSSEVIRLEVGEQVIFMLTASGGVTAFGPQTGWRTLIPHKGYEPVPKGDILAALVYRDELWLGFKNGQMLVYNERKHELRRADSGLEKNKETPQFLTHLVPTPEHLWGVVSKGEKGAGQLFRYTPARWIPVDTEGTLVKKIAGLGDGLLALTEAGTLLYFPDDLGGPMTFFDDAVPDLLGQRSMVVAVSKDQTRIFLAPQEQSRASQLYIYYPRRHSWSVVNVPTLSGVKELHERSGKLYVVTDAGGFLRLDDPIQGVWTEMISERGLDPKDAAAPRIISAAKGERGQIYVVFESGNTYDYNPITGAWLPVASSPADVRQVMASQRLLLYRQRNGVLAVTQQASQKSVAMLTGGLGRRPEGILLAAADAWHRLWILTTEGQVGAYNLTTHNWDLVRQLPGDSPFRLLRWGIIHHSKSHDVVWLATNHSSVVFKSGQSDVAMMAEFPHEELHEMLLAENDLFYLVFHPLTSGGSGGVYRLGLYGTPSRLGLGFPLAGNGVAIKEVRGEVWVRTDNNHIVAYSPDARSWRVIAIPTTPGGWLRLPSLADPWEVVRGVPTIAWAFGIVLVLSLWGMYLIGFRHPHLRRRRQARQALVLGLVLGLIYPVVAAGSCLVYAVWQVNIVLWPSTASEVARGQEGPLQWRTHQHATDLSIQGHQQGKPVFDQQGRFLFDAVQRLNGDGKTIKLHTPIGAWSFHLPDHRLPENFKELKPSFQRRVSALPTPSSTGRSLFKEGQWSWDEYPEEHVIVRASSEARTVLRQFHGGRWGDMVVNGLVVPDDETQPIFIDTPAGIVVLRESVEPGHKTTRDLMSLTEVMKSYDLAHLRESGIFRLRESTEHEFWLGNISSRGRIYQELGGSLEWRFDQGSVTVILNGKQMPMHPHQGRYRLASDIIQDFVVDRDSSRPTFWVRSAIGKQKYALDGIRGLMFLESVARGDLSSPATPRMSADVTYAGTVWWMSAGRVLGRYIGVETLDGVISKGRFHNDIVLDLAVIEGGLLRLATPIGFIDYKYEGSLSHIRTQLGHLDRRGISTRPNHYVFNAHSWQDLAERGPEKAAMGAGAVLNTVDATRGIKPVIFTPISPGVYKFSFDAVSRLRLQSPQVLLQTAAGILNFSLDRKQTEFTTSGDGGIQERADKIAVFDSETSTWHLVEREHPAVKPRESIGGLLNWAGGSLDSRQAVKFVPESRKLPWDHVDYLSVSENSVRIHTRAGIIIPGTHQRRRVAGDPVAPASQGERWAGRACLEPSWGEEVEVRMERDHTWVLCSKRLLRFRGVQHSPRTFHPRIPWASGGSPGNSRP